MIDKRYTNKRERDRLDEHIGSLLMKNHAGYFVPQVRISQYDSITRNELQVHDFIVGAIYQYIERGADKYIGVIESKIVSGQMR